MLAHLVNLYGLFGQIQTVEIMAWWLRVSRTLGCGQFRVDRVDLLEFLKMVLLLGEFGWR